MSTVRSGIAVYKAAGKTHKLAFDICGKSLASLGKEHGVGNEHIEVSAQVSAEGKGSRLRIRLRALKDVELLSFELEAEAKFGSKSRVFVNGWQSWTESREYGIMEYRRGLNRLFFPALNKFLLYNYGDATFAGYSPLAGRVHGWSLMTVRESPVSNVVRLFGSLAERTGFTKFTAKPFARRVVIAKDCKGLDLEAGSDYEAFDLLESEGETNAVFDEYFRLAGAKPPAKRAITGWTSWYKYYEKITEENILQNLETFSKRKVPLDVFQIDDGYQRAVGDWLQVNSKFPGGMKEVAHAIHSKGYKAGLWLAPFACESKSLIVTEHPDWIVKDDKGEFLPIGNNPFNWSGYWFALDVYHPGVREYLRKVFDTVLKEWGFDLVKLDFLYAACLKPRPDKTRGMIMRDAMEFIRECVGDKLILGCGLPLAAGFGTVDYCRIGSDVSLGWEDGRLKMLNYRERVSTANSLASTIGRQFMNGRAFGNDPDVFILRSAGQYMTPRQRKTLYILNLIFGGLVFTSDDVGEYTEPERKFYLAHFPHKPKRIASVDHVGRLGGILRVKFEIGGRKYLCFSNQTAAKTSLPMERGNYFENLEILPREFLPDLTHDGFIAEGYEVHLMPHETRVFLKVEYEPFVIVGSTGHVFPACEVKEFSSETGNVRVVKEPDARVAGKLIIGVPDDCEGANVNGVWKPAHRMGKFNGIIYDWK